MGKSLGDYNIEKSSSSDLKNIKWTQKNIVDIDKLKNKKKIKRNTSSSNIIYAQKVTKVKTSAEKFFKLEGSMDTKKSKNKKEKTNKRFRNTSASNCNIEQGFTRSAR